MKVTTLLKKVNIVIKSLNERDLLNMGIDANKTPASFSTEAGDVPADITSNLIEEKVQQVAAQFKEIYDLWLAIYCGKENYEEAKKEWARLSVDETVPVEVGTKRQRQK